MLKPFSKFSILHSKFSLFIILFSLFFILFVALAFDNPTSSPPTGGGYLQTQSGQLLITKPTKVTSGNNFIVENGNVGIGTTAPLSPLDIQNFGSNVLYDIGGGGKAYSLLNLKQTNGSNNRSVISIGNNATTPTLTFGAGYEGSYGTSFEIRTDIMGAGSAGAGFSNLSQALVIKRQSKDGSTTSVASMITAPQDLGIATGYTLPSGAGWNSSRLVITSSGNVGIGTTAPSEKLTVYSPAATDAFIRVSSPDNYKAGIKFGEDQNPTQTWGHRILYDGAGDYVRFQNIRNTAVYDVMTFDYNGNVGIGTTNPLSKLDVTGGIISVVDVNNRFGAQISGDDGGRAIFGSNLYVASDGTLRTFGTHNSYGYSALEASWGALKFYTASGGTTQDAVVTPMSRMVIDTSGNVGIGTTAPGYKLDVAGDVHGTSFPVSSDIRFKTNIQKVENVLNKLENIQAISFDWNELYQKLGRGDGRRQIGLIAQEVEKYFPELVSEWEQDGVKYKAVDYSRFTAILLEAIKEQQKEINELKAQLTSLK